MSILGIIIILASVASVFVKSLGVDWSQAAVGCGIGIGLLGLKDPNGGGNVAAVALILGMFAIVLVSCQPPISNTHTIETKWRDTTIYLKGDQISSTIETDSIKAVLLALKKQNKPTQIIYKNYNSSSQWASLRYSLDSLGNVRTDCNCKDSAFKASLKEIYDKEVKIVPVDSNELPFWNVALLCLLGLSVVLLVIKLLFK